MLSKHRLFTLVFALLLGFSGFWLGGGMAEPYLRAKYPWAVMALPENIEFKEFYFADNPQVFLEAVDGRIFRQEEGNWVEINPDEIESLEKPNYPQSSCARENLLSDLPIPTLSAKIIDQMACRYSLSPETIGYRQYALLENGSLYTWAIDLGPFGIGKGLIVGFYRVVFGCLGALAGAGLGVMVRRYWQGK